MITDEEIEIFSQTLDGILGLNEPIDLKKDGVLNASMEIALALKKVSFESEIVIPEQIRKNWVIRVKNKNHLINRQFLNPFISMKRAYIVLILAVVALLIGFYQPVLATVSPLFGYVYISELGFLPRQDTRILAQPIQQKHQDQSVTVTRGVVSPTETILFLKFSDIARPVDGAWLELPSGDHLDLKSWRYFPDQPDSQGVQLNFPHIPIEVSDTTLGLKEGWRLPLHWILATQSALPDVQVISDQNPSSILSEQPSNPCIEKLPIKLCLLAATTNHEDTSLLLKVDYLDPIFKRSQSGLTWQNEAQPIQLTTEEGENYQSKSEQNDTLFFPPLREAQKVTLSIPALLADVDIPDQIISVNLGEHPQANDVIPLNAQVQVLDSTIHFHEARLIGDGVHSLRLTLNADDEVYRENKITPIFLELGKPDKIDDLYGSGNLTGSKDIFVELKRPSGVISGTINLPIIGATVIVPGPFEFTFPITRSTDAESSTPNLTTTAVVEANPNNFSPLSPPTALPLSKYHYYEEPIRSGDLLYALGAGDKTNVYLVQPGENPRALMDLPGTVAQVFVHPDRQGIDYLVGVSKTKDGFSYIDNLQLYSVRFDQPKPYLLFTFPPNPENFIGTTVSGNWSFDGRFGIFRLPNTAPGGYGWRFLWMDLNCRQSGDCQAHDIKIPKNLDLYTASFAPADFRILFSGADTSATGKTDLFLYHFNPNESGVELKNLTSSYNLGDGINSAQWLDSGKIFSICSPDSEILEAKAFCWLDPLTGQLTQSNPSHPIPDGMRLLSQYWVSVTGQYLAALFYPISANWGESLPTLHLLSLNDQLDRNLDQAKYILSADFSPDERFLAYLIEQETNLKLDVIEVKGDLHQNILTTLVPSNYLFINWIH